LAGIISYLHLAGPNPILHLDLQPKNLLLCHDTVKLIDFGLAASVEDANMPGERYGTVGCAAPEQYSKDGILDERTDIYAIGAIIHYLLTGEFPKLPYKPAPSMAADLAAVLKGCIKKEKEERFSSAQELEERLGQLKNMGTAAKDRLQSSSLTIALAGSKSGAGTTHIGIGLSVYLRNHGYPNLFVEKNDSGMGAGLGDYSGAKRDQFGLMTYRSFVWRSYYGPGVKLKEPPYKILILDYGKNVEEAMTGNPDAVILVCDGSSWSRNSAFFSAEYVVKGHNSYGIVYNHVTGETRIRLPDGTVPSRCLKAPYYPNPFEMNAETENFYKTLLGEILEIKNKKTRRGDGFGRRVREWISRLFPGKGRIPGKG
jgi:serine/threonine-protein kinase